MFLLIKKELTDRRNAAVVTLVLIVFGGLTFALSIYPRLFSTLNFAAYSAAFSIWIAAICSTLIEIWYVMATRRNVSEEPISSADGLLDYYSRSYRLGRSGGFICVLVLVGLLGYWFFGAALGYWVWFYFAGGAIILILISVSLLFAVAVFFGRREEKTKKTRIQRLINQIEKTQSHP